VAVVASIGYLRTERALRGEALERTKAEANANLAIQAIDRTFERLYPTRLGVRRQPGVEGLRGEIMPAPNVPVLSKETAALLEEMLSFYDRLAQQTGNSDKLRLRTAEASRRVGAIRQRLGQPKEAVAAYQRSIALFRELSSRSPRTPSLTLSVAQIQNELGRLFTSERQTEEARRSHQAALELLEPDAGGASAPPDARFELARTYFFLGLPERPLPTKTPRQEGGSEPAPVEHRDSLAKAVTLLGAFSASPPVDPEYEHLLALCYLEGATVEDGRTSEAGGGDERAIGILERLVKGSPSFPDYAYDLTEAYMRVPIPQPPVPPEVENRILERFSKALALVDKLASQHPDVPDYLVSEARIHHKLGSIHRQMERWADAEQCFRKAMGIQTLLVNRFPDSPSYRVWMATFRIALADALNRRDEPAEARVELEGTIPALLRQVTQWPEMNSLHDLLSLAYAQLEVALRQQGEDALAAEAARKAEQERSFARRAP